MLNQTGMWNPFEGHHPTDKFSIELLKSVPKKVFAWLENLGEDLSRAGQHGLLKWNFDTDAGTIIYFDEEQDDYVQLWFTGSTVDPKTICGSDPRFIDIRNNLAFFAEAEKKIYSELELMQEEYDKPQEYEFPKPESR